MQNIPSPSAIATTNHNNHMIAELVMEALDWNTGFTKDELIFLEEPPKEIEIECPICLQVMLNDPHLVSCCGHHFCGTCIKRVKDINGACPYCKRTLYQAVSDKGRLRIINGLKVNCTNKGCEWKGELKDLSAHLNKGKREGRCQYEEVTCPLNGCEIKKQRQYLEKHERYECRQRPYRCQHCQYRGRYHFIVTEHYPQCTKYPVLCPNKCGLQIIPRGNLQTHLAEECPLQSVECDFKWAGCQYTPLRKHIQLHNDESQLEHMSLLAKECRELKKANLTLSNECSQTKKENEEVTYKMTSIENECAELKKENHKLTQKILRVHHTVVGDTYPIPPVHVPLDSEEFHFYSDICGHHMTASVSVWGILKEAVFTVYKGKFQQPKVTKVVIKLDGASTTTLTTSSNCCNYHEYTDDDVEKSHIAQEFSFLLSNFSNLEIISVS